MISEYINLGIASVVEGVKVCLGYMGEDLVEAFKEKLARSKTTK